MLLLAYSGDAVYLYSTADDPGSEHASSSQTSPSPLRSPNPKRRNLEKSVDMTATSLHEQNGMEVDELGVLDPVNLNADQDRDSEDSRDDDSDYEGYLELVDSSEADEESFLPHVPVVFPRRRFAGARNIATIKDGGLSLF